MEDKIIELKITVKQVNIVLAHLSKGTYSEVIELINSITNQGNVQIAVHQNAAVEQKTDEVKTEVFAEMPSSSEAMN